MYRLDTGEEIELGKKLGEGGEGTVHLAVNLPGAAVKIWKDGQGGEETARKVRAMVSRPPDGSKEAGTTWPTALVTDQRGVPAGFTMPALDHGRHRSVFNYFNPASRNRLKREASREDLLAVARNLALAVDAVHRAGHVIGDVNEKNTMVEDGLGVTLVDADSMQVTAEDGRTHRCTKGRDDYTPPRLQGAAFRNHDRTPQDDLFGAAVLIFKLIMEGVHPFASTADPGAARGITLGEKIKREYFPYNESGTTPGEHRPSLAYQEAWKDLDFNLRHLFRRAFDPDARGQGGRPSAREWVQELERVIEHPQPRRARRPGRPPQNRMGEMKKAMEEGRKALHVQQGSRKTPQSPPNTQPQGTLPAGRTNFTVLIPVSIVVLAAMALMALTGTPKFLMRYVQWSPEPAAAARETPGQAQQTKSAAAQRDHALMCDQILMRELVFRTDAVEAEAVNSLIAGIQKNRGECAPEVWNPRALPRVDHSDPGGCFGSGWRARGGYASVGGVNVPAGLRENGKPLGTVRNTTGRDIVNNAIVYWGEKKPGDGASCWLYAESLDRTAIPAWASGPGSTR